MLMINYICNEKDIPFIATLARLATELIIFDEEQRGGLLIEDKYGYNALQLFASSSDVSYGEVHYHLVDNVCLAQFIRSSKMGLLKKEDVCDHCLVQALCLQNYFANPAALARTNGARCLPLHYAAEYLPIQGFL
mmetsp:Transcript_10465/g.11863  ORF Transcript_10465/g.11863 Transcript_10465/m.11863 type:complete len:135 (+) Transcript_10465:252-656(+)